MVVNYRPPLISCDKVLYLLFPSLVDGGYGPWSEFSACSTTCGDGLKHRSRQCNQPAPEHGGRNCNHLGYAKEDAVCNLGEC